MGLFADAWNALTGHSSEPTIQQRIVAQAQAERDSDARRRFATEGTMADAPARQRDAVGIPAQNNGASKPRLPENIKNAYQASWQEIVQNEADSKTYQKIKKLGSDIAGISGKKAGELTDADFKAFGITKDQYTTVLSRLAMDTAVRNLKALADGRVTDSIGTFQSMEGMLADTEYAKKGGMKHAKEVMLSLSGLDISFEQLDEVKKVIGQMTAESLGEKYRETQSKYETVEMSDMKKLIDAIVMAGEDPSNDSVIRKYTGQSREEFLGNVRGDAGERYARGDHLAIDEFREIKTRISGRGR